MKNQNRNAIMKKRTRQEIKNNKEKECTQLSNVTEEPKQKRKKTEKEEIRYAVFIENNGKERETMMHFLEYDLNKVALHNLLDCLNDVNQELIGDNSTYTLDLEHLVSETTVQEMCKVRWGDYLGGPQVHRGKMKKVDWELKEKDYEPQIWELDNLLYMKIGKYFPSQNEEKEKKEEESEDQ